MSLVEKRVDCLNFVAPSYAHTPGLRKKLRWFWLYSLPQNRNSTIYLTHYICIFQRGKRISKVRVLTKAIDYIKNLHGMVMDHDGIPHSSNHGFNYHEHTADSSLFAF